MKILLDEGLIHGDCLTVTGKTVKENLKDAGTYPKGQEIVRPVSNPLKKDSHIVILRGNLAPEGAVAKISGQEGFSFTGKAIVFNSEEEALKAILGGKVKKGHVIVIRYEGPRGARHEEMLSLRPPRLWERIGQGRGLITDRRVFGGRTVSSSAITRKPVTAA
jgi:dihydroxy-acid dehydratase